MRLILLSFGFRIFSQISVILIPYFLFGKDIYGAYIYIYSVCQLGAYLLDYGFSLYVLRSRVKSKFFKELCIRLNQRDISYLMIGVIICILNNSLYCYVIGTVVGAIWVGRLSKIRVVLGPWAEALSFFFNSIGILISLFACWFFEITSIELLFISSVVLPRVLAIITSILLGVIKKVECIKLKRKIRFNEFCADIRWLSPYAVQGVFTAASMNLDAIVLSLLNVGVEIVADVKLIMTLIGGLTLPVDVIGQYKISASGKSNSKDGPLSKIHNLEFLVSVVSVISSIAAVSFIYFYKNINWIAFVIVPTSVFCRARSICLANNLTILGRYGQSRRVLVQILANFTYWIVLLIGAYFDLMSNYLAAILFVSFVHYGMMKFMVFKA
jgi:hypothetical protein